MIERLLGFFAPAQSLVSLTRRFLPWTWYALVVLLGTGTLLIVGEPARALTNPEFALKMVMLVGIAAATLAVQRPLLRDATHWEKTALRRSLLKSFAVASLLLWSMIVCAGRWIAYIASW
jgi:hypothetical protein